MITMEFSALFRTFSLLALLAVAAPLQAAAPLGLFEDQTGVGAPALAGSAAFDSPTGVYTITGAGKNMWDKADAFHYVWKKISGDASLSAGVRWPAPGKNAHRKACLLIRQNLDAGSPYVDAALHGDGLTSLQFRMAPGETTCEIRAAVTAPSRIGIEKQGDLIFMTVAGPGQPLRRAGGSVRLQLTEPFYVGLAVCSHDDAVLETAEFADVRLSNEQFVLAAKPLVESTLEVIDIASKNRRVIYQAPGRFEAPNWTPDGKAFLFNAQGRIMRLPLAGGDPQPLESAPALKCNNDHGLSPDGAQLAVSSADPQAGSRIYVLPAAGGAARLVTPRGPSYWHGWSPDGLTLAYCAQRAGEFDVYTIPAAGGEEKRLTTAPGLDDGPEYSPDGQWIYFNSLRSGSMQLWRMRPDGAAQEQLTSDDCNNWFPHLSPDGQWVAFVSFEKSIDPKLHPADKNVLLRLMPAAGGPIQTLATVFGGQGTINVNSWSPDGKQLAFVSYLLVNP